MPSLIDIRRRIRSVKSTQQITKAMKMVSAAKLRRAQDRVVAARPYASVLQQMLSDVVSSATPEMAASLPLLARRPDNRIQLVLFTGDRGLAGAFNSNIIRAGQRFIEERRASGGTVEIITAGKKGREFFRKQDVSCTADFSGIFHKVHYADAQAIAKQVTARFAEGEIDSVYLLYNEFKSVASQVVSFLKVLPVEAPAQANPVDFIFEQPPGDLLASLLPRYIEVLVFRAMVESAASEHAARMTAMDAATSNAADMIERLTLYMNRVRQASITREIIEVVSGASALD
jgi:F-type H+-transporting ATPase subunit gamma